MVVDRDAANRAVRITAITKSKVTVKGNGVSNQTEHHFPFDLIVQRQNQKNDNDVNVFIKVDD